jgi:hypothetical protein
LDSGSRREDYNVQGIQFGGYTLEERELLLGIACPTLAIGDRPAVLHKEYRLWK